ncbi:MAG: sigma-70 family RNA polymerase sigma factor [Planctomycetota bacterium]
MSGESRSVTVVWSALEAQCRPLIERCKLGDASALNDLITLVYPFVCEQIHNELGREIRKRVDTQDIAQTSIRQVLKRGPPRIESLRGFVAFWLVVAETKILQAVRDHRRQKRDLRREVEIQETTAGSANLISPHGSPLVALLLQEDLLLLSRAMFRLREEERLLIIERDLEERSFEAIAADLERNGDAVRKAHTRAKARLLTYLTTMRKP